MSATIKTNCPRDCYDGCGILVSLIEPGPIESKMPSTGRVWCEKNSDWEGAWRVPAMARCGQAVLLPSHLSVGHSGNAQQGRTRRHRTVTRQELPCQMRRLIHCSTVTERKV